LDTQRGKKRRGEGVKKQKTKIPLGESVRACILSRGLKAAFEFSKENDVGGGEVGD